MKVILFGATGMVGQGVLRECLLDPQVERVLVVGRSSIGMHNPKLRELLHQDFTDFSSVEDQLAGYDACFFCLGTSSAGMNEQAYRRVTYDFTLAAANALIRKNPAMTFIYVSGAGTDSSERGRFMWARVKGETENALLRLPFKSSYMFRPGYIQPVHGATSKTKLYRRVYAAMAPLYPVWKTLLPNLVITTEELGRAMIKAATDGAPKRVLETPDIKALLRANRA